MAHENAPAKCKVAMIDASREPDHDPPPLDYAPRRGRRPRTNALIIMGMLIGGLIAGGVLMYFTILAVGSMSGDRGIAMMFGLPAVLGAGLMCVRNVRIFGAGVALAPAMAILALYAICGH